MYYEERSSTSKPVHGNVKIVDLRSDTLTKPTETMRRATYEAEVGDDVYQEDPTVKRLEERAAGLLGMEASIFVASGTMGNLIATMVHCDTRGCEAYCGEDSHVFLHEQGGASQLAGVTLCTLRNNPDGSFSLQDLRSKLRKDRHHEPISKLVLLENTMNGRVVPMSFLKDLRAFCGTHGLKLHMDGARLWNASVASSVDVKEIVSGFDSVTFCLSKGLGAPVGSLLCGSRDFVERARRVRKVLGGGMRQVGVLAAAGLVALEENVRLLKEDHRRAKFLAEKIHGVRSGVFGVDLENVESNMVFVEVKGEKVDAVEFARRLREVQGGEEAVVKCLALGERCVRFVTYLGITDEMLDVAVRKILKVMKELEGKEGTKG